MYQPVIARDSAARAALALLLAASAAGSAGAQLAPAATTGITVLGRGVVRVKADEVRFSAALFSSVRGANGMPGPADVDGAAEAVARALRSTIQRAKRSTNSQKKATRPQRRSPASRCKI